MRRWELLYLIALSLLFPTLCQAQTREFQWKWGHNYVATQLAECQEMEVIVESLTSNASTMGTPPYYFIAFELGGVPTTSMVGSDPSNLSWTVQHKQGSALMLTVIDSDGNTGGVAPYLYNVTAGSNTSCMDTTSHSSQTSLAQITSNVTGSLTTCDYWGLTVANGTAPYNYTVVLAATDSPVVTNISIPAGDDVLTWPNRANPNGQLLAAVVDANGLWGYATQVVNTVGSNNTDCVGLLTTTSTVAQVEAEAAARARAAELVARRRRDLIIGLVLGVSMPLILASAAGAWWWSQRKAYERGDWDGQDARARPWDGYGVNMRLIPRMEKLSRREMNYSTDSTARLTRASSADAVLPSGPPDYSSPLLTTSAHFGRKGVHRRDALGKLSASEDAPQLPPLSFEHLGVPGVDMPAHAEPNYTALTTHDPDADDVEPDIIIQHRDGGAGIVQELPPPYLDRYDRAAS